MKQSDTELDDAIERFCRYRQSVKETKDIISANLDLDRVDRKKAEGISASLERLSDTLVDEEKDFLSCLAVKISSEVFKLILNQMPENMSIEQFINQKGEMGRS